MFETLIFTGGAEFPDSGIEVVVRRVLERSWKTGRPLVLVRNAERAGAIAAQNARLHHKVVLLNDELGRYDGVTIELEPRVLSPESKAKALMKRAVGRTLVVAFWDGRWEGPCWLAMREAASRGFEVVTVERETGKLRKWTG